MRLTFSAVYCIWLWSEHTSSFGRRWALFVLVSSRVWSKLGSGETWWRSEMTRTRNSCDMVYMATTTTRYIWTKLSRYLIQALVTVEVQIRHLFLTILCSFVQYLTKLWHRGLCRWHAICLWKGAPLTKSCRTTCWEVCMAPDSFPIRLNDAIKRRYKSHNTAFIPASKDIYSFLRSFIINLLLALHLSAIIF